jgi:hypothetical protein
LKQLQFSKIGGREPTFAFVFTATTQDIALIANAMHLEETGSVTARGSIKSAQNALKIMRGLPPIPPDAKVLIGRVSERSFVVTMLKSEQRVWLIYQRY